MRNETINFKEFCQGKNTNRKLSKTLKLHSSTLFAGVTIKSLFHLPPLIAGGYMAVGFVGVAALGLSLFENKLAKHGKHVEADRVATFGSLLFPIMFCGSLIGFAIYAYRTFLM
ncbi:MAG: hypothetical protein ACQET8_23195 [Bacillota bacterium]